MPDVREAHKSGAPGSGPARHPVHSVQDERRRKPKEVAIRREVWIALGTLAVDQASKVAVSVFMSPGDSVEVLGTFFRLTYIHNPYAVFGIAVGPPKLYLLFSLFALGVVVWAFIHAYRGLPRYALALVLGGALGNLLDRLRMGSVVDFLDFGVGRYRWPVFNVADSAVTVGIALLIWGYVGRKDRD